MRAMEEPMRQSINACVSSYARSRFKPADPTLARSRLHARIEMHLQAHRAWEMPCFSCHARVCERRSALLCEQHAFTRRHLPCAPHSQEELPSGQRAAAATRLMQTWKAVPASHLLRSPLRIHSRSCGISGQ